MRNRHPSGDKKALHEKIAKFWDVDPRTVRLWVQKGHPVEDAKLMAWTLISAPKTNAKLRKRAEEVRAEIVEGKKPDPTEPELEGADLESLGKFYAEKVRQSIKNNEPAKIQFWSDLLIKTENNIRQNKLAEKKLGIEKGELLPKELIERWLFAIGFWMMRGVDQSLRELAGQFDDPKEAYKILDEYLLNRRFLSPLALASGPVGNLNLPDWFIEKLQDTVDDYIENGYKQMKKKVG